MTKLTKWTPQEEEYLKNLREEEDIKDWCIIAEKLNTKFTSSQRRSKQCRERYMNYTRFGNALASSLDWSAIQEQIIMRTYLEFGSSWKEFREKLPQRSENCIKNKFYSGLRKFIRRFKSVSQKKYALKFETVRRVLTAIESEAIIMSPNYEMFSELRLLIITFSQLSHKVLQPKLANEMQTMLIQFNKEMRHLCLNKNMSSGKKIKKNQESKIHVNESVEEENNEEKQIENIKKEEKEGQKQIHVKEQHVNQPFVKIQQRIFDEQPKIVEENKIPYYPFNQIPNQLFNPGLQYYNGYGYGGYYYYNGY